MFDEAFDEAPCTYNVSVKSDLWRKKYLEVEESIPLPRGVRCWGERHDQF